MKAQQSHEIGKDVKNGYARVDSPVDLESTRVVPSQHVQGQEQVNDKELKELKLDVKVIRQCESRCIHGTGDQGNGLAEEYAFPGTRRRGGSSPPPFFDVVPRSSP